MLRQLAVGPYFGIISLIANYPVNSATAIIIPGALSEISTMVHLASSPLIFGNFRFRIVYGNYVVTVFCEVFFLICWDIYM